MHSNVFIYCLLNLPFYHHVTASTLHTPEAATPPAGYVELGEYLTPKLSVTAVRSPSKRDYGYFWGRQEYKAVFSIDYSHHTAAGQTPLPSNTDNSKEGKRGEKTWT